MTEVHSRFDELLPAHVLGTLDGAERAELEAHLSDCPTCRQELDSWRRVLVSVAEEVAPEPVSADLRRRVLSTTERPLTAGYTASAPRDSAALPSEDRSVVAPAPDVTPMAEVTAMPVRRTPSWVPWAALAASLLALVVSWAGWMVRDLPGIADGDRQATVEPAGPDGADDPNSVTSGELERAREEIEALHQRIDRLSLAVQALGTPNGRTYALASDSLEQAPRGAVGATFVDARLGRGTFHAFGLPEAPEGKTYQLWRITGGTPESAGVFDVGPDGSGSLSLDGVDPQDGDAWAVTVERAGGVQSPTMDAMVLTTS